MKACECALTGSWWRLYGVKSFVRICLYCPFLRLITIILSTLFAYMYRAGYARGCSFCILFLSMMTATVPSCLNAYSSMSDGGLPNQRVWGT